MVVKEVLERCILKYLNFYYGLELTRTIIPLSALGLLIDRLQNSTDNFSNFSGVSLLSSLKVLKH
jgi:hypothetical protein